VSGNDQRGYLNAAHQSFKSPADTPDVERDRGDFTGKDGLDPGPGSDLQREEPSNRSRGASVRLPQLRRVRWAVRTTLTLGVAASVAANVLHALPNLISQAIAAWPPLALLLTVELISRVPMHRRSLAAARLFATAAIAGIAAWVSYWHMAGVASRYGETGASAYLLPLSVDGLIVVASVCLVELAGRIRDLEIRENAAAVVPAAPAVPAAAPVPASPAGIAGTPEPVRAPVRPPQPPRPGVDLPRTPPEHALPVPVVMPAMPQLTSVPMPGSPVRSQPHRTTPTRPGGDRPTRQRRPVAETAALAAEIERHQPDVTAAELAAQLGISIKRLQAIRREVRELQPAVAA
jgi:Protein of unknown function (DUF2637)